MKDRALPGTGGEHRQTQLRRWLHGISTDAPGQFVHRIALTGVTPSDTEEERVKKATLTLSTMLITPLSLVWTAVYASLHLWIPALIPFLYFLASGTTLVYFFRSLRYRWFRELQLGLMLLLPFCLQWSLGGYRASSAVSIWAFASPLGALMFSGIRRSRPWFAGFVALTAVSAVLDPVLSAHAARIPSTIATIMFVLNIVGVMGTSFLLLLYFVGERERIAAALAVEREKSDRLLLNTLPAPIAARLKESPATIADGFEGVTVLFADIVGFTELASELEPGEVVALLDGLFSTFDRLADRHGLEKIKTIGDAYMVAGGLPVYRADHTEAVVEMGLDMVDAVSGLAGQIDVPLSVRIGIDCGPVVAGVIGRRKFIYDLWGDTVNTASRMESHGVAGSIQVTPRVFEKLKDRYQFSAREPMPIKGKGVMAPYLVVGRTAVSAASVLLDKERSVQPVPLT